MKSGLSVVWRLLLRSSLLLMGFVAGVRADAQTQPLPLLPSGIAYDASGNLYFADTNRNQVFEATLAGTLVVVAGSGVQGFSGDGASAVAAMLNEPQSVAVGPDGTLYIADMGNQRVRAVSGGLIRTIAGSGVRGFSGDGGTAVSAALNQPNALAIDASGAVLVCDSGNHRVRRVANGTITTIAGNGTQGFAGDGVSATNAELDTPSGVAVASDGRIFIADAHNNRIRVIGVNGTVATFAGTGVTGYSGDGGAAIAAKLALPRGLAMTANGSLLFADSNNQRVRSIDANGIITTVIGSGVQGSAADGVATGVAMLNQPRSVGVSSFAEPSVADAANRLIRILAPNSDVYVASAFAPARTSSVSLSLASSAVYGQSSAAVTVSGSAATPMGTVQLLEGTSVDGQATLANGSASIALSNVPVGAHSVTVVYAGDGINPAATGVTSSLSVSPATVTATADAATVVYGEPIPSLTGTVSGVLAQDSGNVNAVFSSAAQMMSPAGVYPIDAALTGPASGNYVVALSPSSGALQITQAQSSTSLSSAAASYNGLPLLLTAAVSPATRGTPTGTVRFSEGANVVATASLANGTATGTYLNPAAGTHSIVAAYQGDNNFASSTSAPMTATVGAMPDFTLAVVNGSSQSVQGGLIATYTFTVAAQPAPFTGAVVMAATGAPSAATISFSPTQVVPGVGSANVTMSVETTTAMAHNHSSGLMHALPAVILFLIPFAGRRRKKCAITLYGLVLLGATAGCGNRTLSSSSQPSKTYTFTVTATSTNLAGAVVTHSVPVTLIVE